MGLRDKYAKKIEEKGFQPLDLNEGNVEAIYNRCLATEDEKKNIDLVYESQIFREGLVFHDGKWLTSETICFSKEKVSKNLKNICYLLGQLETAHTQSKIMPILDGVKKYDGSIWTGDMDIVFQLYHLALVTVRLLAFFEYKGTVAAEILISFIPTLSPKAPNFPAWWEAHKAKWEDEWEQ